MLKQFYHMPSCLSNKITPCIKIANNFYDHSPPYADSRSVVVNYKRKYVHEVLVIHLVKLAQEKLWLGELTASTLR